MSQCSQTSGTRLYVEVSGTQSVFEYEKAGCLHRAKIGVMARQRICDFIFDLGNYHSKIQAPIVECYYGSARCGLRIISFILFASRTRVCYAIDALLKAPVDGTHHTQGSPSLCISTAS